MTSLRSSSVFRIRIAVPSAIAAVIGSCAEGFSNALKTIFGAAKGVDEKTMTLQYLEALKALAAGASTKWIVPMELAELTRPLAGMMRAAREANAPPTEG